MDKPSRRAFVGAAVTMAAAGKLEALAIDGGAKAVTIPGDQHGALTKWPRYGAEEKAVVAELLETNRFYQEIPLREDESRKYLKIDYAKEVMRSLVRVWKRPVNLASITETKQVTYRYDGSEHSQKTGKAA